MQIYSNPKRASDPDVLPDIEVYHVTAEMDSEPGWYWRSLYPGSDVGPIGPFATEAAAIADAQSGDHDE